MRKVIHKIRMQPPEFRVMVAVLAAMVMTSIIGYFWIGTLSTGIFQKETTATPSPFSALIENIKDTVSKNKSETDTVLPNQNSVQVIDSSNYDESQPASSESESLTQ